MGGFSNKEVARAAGRKGKPGKHEKTKKIEALLESLEGKNAERFQNALDKLSDEEFIKTYKDLIKYIVPAKTHSTIEAEGLPPINFVHASSTD